MEIKITLLVVLLSSLVVVRSEGAKNAVGKWLKVGGDILSVIGSALKKEARRALGQIHKPYSRSIDKSNDMKNFVM